MLNRISTDAFLGMDLYQNETNTGFAERIGAALDWTESRGHPNIMVGIGETAACTKLGASPKPETWIRNNWAWCTANADRVGAVSYFNSTANSEKGYIWSLEEPRAKKLATYKAMLASPIACRLR